MIATDSAATTGLGNSDVEEDYENPTVDEGRCPRVEDARAREDEDNGDRAQAQADLVCNVSAGIKTRRDTGDGSKEAESMTGLRAN